ncbi:hypothetical protein [Sphingomonas echinoides]|uniref:hypothetical protein n=1 Tax=Sphingomonas echinoides TaxID=59803 RepID=UPI002413547A|nr:hypothetical protein [Sphingomonas echinoides]
MSNDEDAVVEHLAETMWDSRQDHFEVRTPWSEAGGTWQAAFREMAKAAVQALRAANYHA